MIHCIICDVRHHATFQIYIGNAFNITSNIKPILSHNVKKISSSSFFYCIKSKATEIAFILSTIAVYFLLRTIKSK